MLDGAPANKRLDIVRRMTQSQAKRVLLVTHTGEVGGAETAMLRLVDALDPARFTTSAILLADGPLAEELRSRQTPTTVFEVGALARVTRGESDSARRFVRNAFDSLRVIWGLRGRIAAEKPDLVVANSLKSAVLLWVAAPLAGRPWIWHLHDRIAVDYVPRPVVGMLQFLARFGPRKVIANSRATADTVGGVSARVVVAYPGIPQDWFTGKFDRKSGSAVGIVGRISATKGQFEFLDAIELLGTKAASVRFRIVGAALFEDAAIELAVKEKVAASEALRQVELAGWTDDPVREIAQLRMLVHASPVPEPFGQVIVEAMAVGTPVIATDAGGVPEILSPLGKRVEIAEGVARGEFGILVRPGDARALADAIQWAMTHDELVMEMARNAYLSARARFAIEQTSRIVQDVWSV